MKISIAMATYNGAKYLKEQLDSFLWQTRLPDELVITDDGSTDETLQILHEFARKAPFEVRVVINEQRLGYAGNFDKALSLTTGDLIFLSDQDDVWFKDKIEVIEWCAIKDPGVLLWLNDAELADCDGRPLNLTKLGQTLSLGLAEESFTTGCCMALRREILHIALPVPVPVFVHDTWLNGLSLVLGSRKVVPRVLQYYRRHNHNASKWIASRTKKQGKIDLIKDYWNKNNRPFLKLRLEQLRIMLRRLEERRGLVADGISQRIPGGLSNIVRECHAVEIRLKLLSRSRIFRWFYAMRLYISGGYSYFSGVKSFIKDVILA